MERGGEGISDSRNRRNLNPCVVGGCCKEQDLLREEDMAEEEGAGFKVIVEI